MFCRADHLFLLVGPSLPSREKGFVCRIRVFRDPTQRKHVLLQVHMLIIRTTPVNMINMMNLFIPFRTAVPLWGQTTWTFECFVPETGLHHCALEGLREVINIRNPSALKYPRRIWTSGIHPLWKISALKDLRRSWISGICSFWNIYVDHEYQESVRSERST